MIKSFLTACIALLPLTAAAQTAVVRTGDHPDFTRLTVPMPTGTDWQLDQAAQDVSLQFSGALQRLDISQAFTRISRDRIAAITTGAGPALNIQLACDCVAEAFVAANNLLVVDVAPGSASPAAVRPNWRPALPNLYTAGTLRFGPENGGGIAPPRPARPAQPAPVQVDLPRLPTAPRNSVQDVANDSFARSAINGLPSTVPDPGASGAELTRELETRLLAAIGQAATEGLLEADPSNVSQLPDDVRQMSDPATTLHGSDPGLSAKPSTLEADEAEDPRRYMLSRDSCMTHLAPFMSSADDEPFVRRLGQLRSALTEEFDRDNPRAYLELAQFYLLNGFGAEARQLVASVPQQPEVHDEIVSIANIMDYGHDHADGAFANRLDCETEAAMWAALTGPRIPPGSVYDGAAIKRSVMTLPAPLKSYLGPLLAERFTIAQEKDFAKDILRLVDRDIEEPTARRDLAEALIQTEETGQPDREAYDALIANNDEISPEALLHFTNETLAAGNAVDAETIGLLESYRTQFRDSEVAIRLLQAEILAHASAGNFPTAFDLFTAGRPDISEIESRRIAETLAGDLAEKASDAVFARMFFQNEDVIALADRTTTQNRVAERLLDLGFLEAAGQMVTRGADGTAGRDRRILRARIALADNRPRAAEAELFGLEGEDIDRLRAEARLMASEFGAAKDLFTAAGDTAAADEAAWLARDWNALRSREEAPASRLAEVVTAQEAAPVTLPEVGPPTLAASRDALTQATETRAALQELLSTMQVDTALDQ